MENKDKVAPEVWAEMMELYRKTYGNKAALKVLEDIIEE